MLLRGGANERGAAVDRGAENERGVAPARGALERMELEGGLKLRLDPPGSERCVVYDRGALMVLPREEDRAVA